MQTAAPTRPATAARTPHPLAAGLAQLPSSRRFNAAQRQTLYRMAYGALAAGDYELARGWFETLVLYASADGRVWRGLAAAVHALGDHASAWMYWNMVTMIENGPPDATFYAARCLAQLGNLAGASEAFDLVANDERAEPAMRSQAAQLLALLQQRRAT